MKKLLAVSVLFLLLNLAAPARLAEGSSANSTASPNQAQPDDSVELGRPVQTPNPVIPPVFRDKSVAVVLSGRMTVEGVFEKLAFVGGTAELADTTVNAVKQWRYTPSTKAGEPVDLDVYVGLRFDHGSVTSFVEPNLPYPTKPATPRTEHKAKIFSIVTGMQTPRATYAPDPEYSQAARAIGLQGTVVLGVIIASDGTMGDVWVERRLGLGLDQKAVDTVRRWKFQPAMKDGEPVAVYAMIEVAFHLY